MKQLSGSARNQYLATFCVNLLSISYGFTCGWTSPSFPILESWDTPLLSGPISSEEGSWIGASLCIGGFIGNLVSGWMADRYGRKLTACLAAIPQIICWIMVIIAKNAYYLMAMRFLGGFSGGVCFMVIPMFIAEISEDRIRGLLASTLVLTCNLGILIMYILGNYVPYAIIPWILLLFPVLFLTSFSFMPDTPFYLMRKNDYIKSEQSLRFFRGFRSGTQHVSNEFKLELVKLKDAFSDEKQTIQDDQLTCKDFVTPHARKAFLIGISLMAFNQFCGCFAMLNYTATVFAESGSSLSANMSAIVIGTIQMFGSYLSTVLVERAGRKLLLVVSGGGIAFGLGIFSGFTYAKSLGYDVASFSWLPLVCFSFAIFIASMGVLTLPFVVLAEIMPQKIKGFASTFCMALLWIFAFIAIKYFSALFYAFGMHGALLLFSLCSLGGTLFVAFMVPETKGKSFETIAELMS
ncbi:facilitated trehalose transporter Tret1-2 homolog [Toxorhynchites rutilus septentrionalis]|uniref:facilitated trehalose transporter Tret1-2 homolog n=1 Tax=Toxorhynchites rutilus septentrionalis TaxID=329112 RepID=UPI0024798FAE|nr:facilitated trehalose transporter Tret1-2 homolog [Toxorhynchites rutilus septentrionalis]